MTVTTALVINPSLYPNLPYDPIKDFMPITPLGTSPHVLVAHPSLPARREGTGSSGQDSPGKYSYASPGTGQSGQLAGEMFRFACELDLAHVPFNGAIPAITSTIAGHTQIAFMSLAAAAGSINSGSLRALALTSVNRSEAFPDIPTMAERAFRISTPHSGRAWYFQPGLPGKLSIVGIATSSRFSRCLI